MMARRQFLGAGATLLIVSDARAQSGLGPEWLGSYAGVVRFYRSIPLEDIYPPPEHPHVDLDSPAPLAVYFSIRVEDGCAVAWLRIDGGPMQTTYRGETLRFAPLAGGFATLIGAPPFQRPLHAGWRRGDRLGVRRRRHARPHLARRCATTSGVIGALAQHSSTAGG
jgi:hypothetical protein